LMLELYRHQGQKQNHSILELDRFVCQLYQHHLDWKSVR